MMNYGAWHTHYEAFHLGASKGQERLLSCMLEYAITRVSRQQLTDLLNTATLKEDGKKGGPPKGGFGTIDLALKCSFPTVAVLRRYGATEQTSPPEKWNRGHRRDAEWAYQQSEAKRVFVFVNNELT